MTEYYDQQESTDAFRARLHKEWPWAEKGWSQGACVGAGWHPLIYRLLAALEGICSKDELEHLEVRDIKEKWGHLSIYVHPQTDDHGKDELIFDMIAAVEMASSEVCDVCGGLGTPREGGWRRTRCDKHEKL